MKSEEWVEVIRKSCEDAGTYRPFFDSVIETLAQILEKRDDAQTIFEESGKEVLVEHTNKGGSTNIEQSPLVRLINDLNRDALAYWRDLGLTPAGLKRINDGSLKEKKGTSQLEKALASLANVR